MTPKSQNSEIDDLCEKNVCRISVRPKEDEKAISDRPHHEEIVTRYNEYPKTTVTAPINKYTPRVRTSLSLQNILDPMESFSVNTNNDFDQNSIIQPDSAYLMNKNVNVGMNNKKPQTYLIDSNGDFWGENGDFWDENGGTKQSDSSVTLRKNINRNENHSDFRSSYKNVPKSTRNRSTNVFSHIESGSKTLPRKSKLLQENISNGENTISTMTESK